LPGLLLLISVPLTALDYGGSLDNASALKGSDELSFTQEDVVSGWISSRLGDRYRVYARGSYAYTLDRAYYFNLDAVYLDGDFGSVGGASGFGLTVGRFDAQDFTGVVLNHTLDGLNLQFDYPYARFRALTGFTGLIQRPSSEIVLSRNDEIELSDTTRNFGAPRLIGAFSLELLGAVGTGDLTVSVLFQEDLRLDEDRYIRPGEEIAAAGLSKGGRMDTQYIGVGLDGSVAPSTYYDVFLYAGLGRTLSYLEDSESVTGYSYQFVPLVGILGGFGVRYYMEETLSSVLSFRATYASGDGDYETFVEGNTDGLALAFVPVSKSSPGLAFAPQYGNIIVGELSYALRPLSSLGGLAAEIQTIAKALLYARPTEGPVSTGAIDPTKDDRYLGSELDLAVNFRPFSDLGVALSTGVFFPGGAFESSDAEFAAGLLFSFSF
jgi:hypothetical protein